MSNTPRPKGDKPGESSPGAPPAIQAPWRLEYLDDLDAGEKKSGPPQPSSGSFIRDYWLTPQADAANHVIVRTAEGMIFLNRYPYAAGHLLVALGDARPSLLDHTAPQRASLWALVDVATELMQRTLEPQGINIGVNQGRAAGAGVPQHVHVHLVPRWGGDVNFMAVVGNIRVIPASLEKMAQRYRKMWAKMAATPPSSNRT
jgi:ATP adenylyltransferase